MLTVLGQTERLNLSGIKSQNTLSFRQRIRAFTIKYDAGFSFKSQRVTAECGDVYFRDSYNQQNFFLTPSVNFERGSWKMNASVKADLLMASSLSRPRLTLQPRLNQKYNLCGTTALQTTYLYSETANELTTLYTTPVPFSVSCVHASGVSTAFTSQCSAACFTKSSELTLPMLFTPSRHMSSFVVRFLHFTRVSLIVAINLLVLRTLTARCPLHRFCVDES